MTAIAVKVATKLQQSTHECLLRRSGPLAFVMDTASDCHNYLGVIKKPVCCSPFSDSCLPPCNCCAQVSACSCNHLVHDQVKSVCLHAERLQELCAYQRLLHHWQTCHTDVLERHQGQHRAGKLCPREQLHLKGRANC